MAFKLTKAQIEQRDGLVTKLEETLADLSLAIEAYNEEFAKLKGPVEAALATYNEALSEAKEFASDIASDADQEISEKTDKWQDSDRGQAATAWKDAWESLSLDEIEIEFPDELEVDDPEQANELSEAPEEAAT